MERKELMSQLVGESNDEVIISEIIESDVDFLDRKIQEIVNQIKDEKRVLKRRLREKVEIDASVVDVAFLSLQSLNDRMKLYKSFKEQYYSGE